MAGEKFIKLIKQSARHAIPENTLTDLVPGEVTKEEPLTILVENRFQIDKDFLILSPFCREFKDKNGSILFENLKVGDKVLLLRVSNGQQFYVLDRGEMQKMIPKFNFVVSEIEDTVQSSKTYKVDSFNGRIISKIDELESVKQAVFKILQTERFENVIYNANYGVELIKFMGKHKDFVKSDIERTIREALLVDERILGVENFNIIDENKDILQIEFKVNSIYGNINLSSEVTI